MLLKDSEISVLIIDDSDVDRFTYERFLQSDFDRSYRFVAAETLEDGLDLWTTQNIDLALVDINLPDGSGLEFLAAIAPQHPDGRLPAIVLTGQGDERTAVQAMKLGAGDYLIKGDVNAMSLCTCVGQVYDRLALSRRLERSQQQNALISEIALRIRQSLDLGEVLDTIVREVRQFLDADRAVIYQFAADMSGTIVAEAVLPPWRSSLNTTIQDTCFQTNGFGTYLDNTSSAISDIDNAPLTDCHRQLLKNFQVRANLVKPILLNHIGLPSFNPQSFQTNPKTSQTLWGLLVVHQCRSPRNWETSDMDFLQQLSVQVAIAIQQAELYRSQQLLNASLEQEKEAVEYANRAKSEFIALTSPEIWTPINRILGLTYQALSKPDITENQHDQLAEIQGSAQLLLQVMNDFILDFSKLEVGALQLEMREFSINSILTNINNILSLKAFEKQIELSFQVGQEIPQRLIGDPLRLGQVLINLASNALQFTNAGGVQLRVEQIDRTDDRVRLRFTVRDTGTGLTADQIASLTNASRPLSLSTLPANCSGQSSALGLAICQHVLSLMGSMLKIESQVGVGSIFSAVIDLGYIADDSPALRSPSWRQCDFNVLVVDDNPLSREALVYMLESFSLRVSAVESGDTAIARLMQLKDKDETFDLIFVDWQMPGLDGLDTIQQLKTTLQSTNVPHILMVTANSRDDIRDRALETGTDVLLLKPISRSQLSQAITAAISGSFLSIK